MASDILWRDIDMLVIYGLEWSVVFELFVASLYSVSASGMILLILS